ncbi:serine protease, S1-C subfamily, contains C-terminal PDZ domain [Jatrophihabitans endophyticus]|uniref:Serine protease, S1-C subfamily, contains C-terminal PDZ domain n=1 Tax=Jatrophihabitans endophyticus TaxID=1206085 RepID=A0A1M5DDD7_9ACTN|nr:trypsin-like peptidase domain-containing protein [Jatrophihabitans endophyticus]SHF64925.1 serine protease, S1-C subfamily, contains C-terminal PDZ domain [Jatrophihabitans endophyticus]
MNVTDTDPYRPAAVGRHPVVGLLAVSAALLAAAATVGVLGVADGVGPGVVDGVGSVTGSLPGNVAVPRPGAASARQQVGIVTIVSTLKYQNARSAGTGMILSADGEVLTNNHVVRGATAVLVTDETTGRSYRATVVGTAPGADVAVLRLRGAHGLRRATLADDARGVRVGDTVTGVGNAGGTGRLTAAEGRVAALDRSITAADENGQDTERLTGLIEVNARIVSGDSGGPLYDEAGRIVGMDTAASASRDASPTAYAIPIEDARGVVRRIESGVETASIHLGYPGFLGVSTKNANGRGAAVAGLLEGGPAAAAGITTGSIVTAVDGTRVTSADTLRALLTRRDPGTSVRVSWNDVRGRARSAVVTLTTGPAD